MCAVCVGCGGAFDSSAEGQVTLDGNALPRGTVAFYPLAGGPTGLANIDESGNYAVRTGREFGLPSGEYEVTVTATEPSQAITTDYGGPPPPGKAITPLWYRAKESSGLKFQVVPGSNEIDLELSSTPPAGWKGAAR